MGRMMSKSAMKSAHLNKPPDIGNSKSKRSNYYCSNLISHEIQTSGMLDQLTNSLSERCTLCVTEQDCTFEPTIKYVNIIYYVQLKYVYSFFFYFECDI